MATVLLILVVVLVLAALVFGVVSLLSGDDPGLGVAEPDGRAVPLPNDRSLTETDLKSVRFDVGWRGYRMAQVDRVLRRTAYDIGYKDEMIAVLEAEVIALRDGRAEDAELLRKARESAANPQPAPATSAAPPGAGSTTGAGWSDGPAVLGDEPLESGDVAGRGVVESGDVAGRVEEPQHSARPERPVTQRPVGTQAPVVAPLSIDGTVARPGTAAVRSSATVEASTTPAEAVTPAAEDGDDRPEGSLAYKPVRRVQLAEEVPGAELDESPADAAAMPPGEASVPADDAPVPTYDDSVPTEDGKVEEPAGPARRSPSAKKSARPASGRSPRGR